MRILWSSQSLSATLVAVTEPKSEPVGPALDVEAKLGRLEPRRDRLRLVDGLCLVPGSQGIAALQLPHEAGSGRLGEAARKQEVARVAASHVDDLAAQAEALDVLTKNDLHESLLAVPRGRRGRAARRRPRDRRGPRPRRAAAPSRARA